MSTAVKLRTVNDYSTVDDLRDAMCNIVEGCDDCKDWKQDNLDVGTSNPQNVVAEAERLMVLKSCNILDSNNHDPAFEEITKLAQGIFHCPIAMITIVDLGRLWLKDVQGVPGAVQVPRPGGLCAHALQRKEECGILIVPDTLQDYRFKEYPLVVGGPKVRFYAAAPILLPEEKRAGVFAIVDNKPRPNGLSQEEVSKLRELASCVAYNMIIHAHDVAMQ